MFKRLSGIFESPTAQEQGDLDYLVQVYYTLELMDIDVWPKADCGEMLKAILFPCCLAPPEQKKQYARLARSFMFALSCLQLVLLIISIIVGGGFGSVSRGNILGPTFLGMVRMGAKFPYLMRYKFQVWRFFMPIFLTGGFVDLLIGFYYQLRFALYLERVWNWKKMATVYCVSGVAAELVFGAKYLANTERTMWLVKMIIILVMWISYAIVNYGDWTSYVGSSIVGFALGLVLLTPNPFVRKAALTFVVLFFILFIAIFYTIVRP
eukprot:gene12292-14410_t